MEKILWRENLFNGDPFDKGTGLRSIKVDNLFKKVTNVIKDNMAKGNLYRTK